VDEQRWHLNAILTPLVLDGGPGVALQSVDDTATRPATPHNQLRWSNGEANLAFVRVDLALGDAYPTT